ncbi:hypothetical protein [Sphingomonas sp. LT1P40]|uniref:hypothetical protein n=1 Tax=Alteristakelama amylovorans TaxID=3096166 RepID=UPI002FCA3107
MKKMLSAAVLLALLSSASPAITQVKPKPRPMMCPDPQYQTIAPASASPVQSQFTPAVWGVARTNLNGTAQNKMFLHTFQWKDDGCCQVMSGKVTIRMKSLAVASARTASDAGNDSFGLWHNGAGIAGSGGYIWPLGTPAGTVVTKTIVLTPAMLAMMNSNNTISVAVQDDTMVQAVQIQLDRCCLTKKR